MESDSNLRMSARLGVKSEVGLIIGFISGVAGFLILFKIIVLDNIPPEDELAPGAVVLASLINGFLFALIGRALQCYQEMNTNKKS